MFLVSTFSVVFGLIAGTLSLLSFFLYICSILRGETKPNRVTWFVLTVVGSVLFTSYYASGARNTLWVTGSYILGPIVVFFLSIRFGEGGWTFLDCFSLTGSGISLILWGVSGSAFLVLLLNILIDFFGILPTLRKSYFIPSSENKVAWLFAFWSSLFNIFAIERWSIEVAVYPVYMFLMNGIITVILYIRNIEARKAI